MSTKRIRWIVVLMAVGLLGLVGFQLYWISNALHLQKEQFAYKVTDALQEVVRTLERQEIVYLTQQRLHAQQQQHRLREIGRGTPTQPTDAKQPTHQLLAETIKRPKSAGSRLSGMVADRRRTLMPNPTMTTPTDVLHPTPQPLTPEQQQVIEAFFRQQNELMAVGDWQTQLLQQQQFDQWVDQVLVEQLSVMNSQMRPDQNDADSLHKFRSFRLKRLRAKRLLETAEASAAGVPAAASSLGKKMGATPNVTTVKSRTVAD